MDKIKGYLRNNMIGVLAILIIVFLVFLFLYLFTTEHRIPPSHVNNMNMPSTCSSMHGSSCTAKDDVNNPAYNMQNVITQTILLEEHLAEENKYCEPCIVKHFLHIIGLIQEAIWMACKNYSDYPKMGESLEIYESNFKQWLSVKKEKDKRLDVLAALRKHRQELIELYYLRRGET